MEDQVKLIESLVARLEQYAQSAAELYKYKALDIFADAASSIVAYIIIVLFAVSGFMILNIGIAFWLGELLGRMYLGFFAVSGFYVLAGCLLFIVRFRLIVKPLRNIIVSQALD